MGDIIYCIAATSGELLKKINRAGAPSYGCVRPDCLLFLFGLPLLLPFFKFPLSLNALVESENVGQDTAGDGLNLMLGNVGVVDGFLSLAQMVSSVSKITKARSSVLSCTLQVASFRLCG